MERERVEITPDAAYVAIFPEIDWYHPLTIRLEGSPDERYACRFCLARFGITGSNFHTLSATEAEAQAHIDAQHPKE